MGPPVVRRGGEADAAVRAAVSHDMETGEEGLNEGDAYRYGGEVWLVERLEPVVGREAPRVYLSLWPNGVPYPPEIKGARF
jgi:hypothetical protein